jgi:integrase
MAIKVSLRKKSISNGRKSLYLDFYPPIPHPETGKPTRREFLKLYLFEQPKGSSQKQHNKETWRLAEQIQYKRENFLNKPEIYSEYEKKQLQLKELNERNFVEYFKELAYKRKNSNHNNWMSALKYLEDFTKGSLLFGELNESILEDFKEYLLNTKSNKSAKAKLSQNSAQSYFNKIKAALKQAYKDGILQTNLNAKVKPIPSAETHREYLTLEEVNQLIKTPCNNTLLKRAALFSTLTGLRFSDIKKLEWHELRHTEGQGYFIKFKQQKTKGAEELPISDQAYQLLGEPSEPNDKIFEGLKYSAYSNKHLHQWIGAAGITKNITFHSFRHTYAVLQLFKGTDLYTVSKMLGHRDIKTTQIYAKIVDDTKRKAANQIKLDIDFDNTEML